MPSPRPTVWVETIESFAALRYDLDALVAERVYFISDAVGEPYGWSPDGVGMYWYPTLTELLANH